VGGVSFLVVVAIVVAIRYWRGEPVQVSLSFRLWFWKGCLFVVLLGFFGAVEAIGKIALAPLFVLLCVPSFVLTRLVVPLGLPRVAYWLARAFGSVKLMQEHGAGAVAYGAMALARRPSPQAMEWLEGRLKRAPASRGAGVAAVGLLAALRGDRDRARSLLRIADTTPPKFIPRPVRRFARDWLVADAARVGDWREVVRLGRRGRDSLRWSYALARIGDRLIGDPQARGDWQLWLLWLVAPRRRGTFALLRRALAVPRAAAPAVAEQPVPANLPDALAGLADCVGNRFSCEPSSFARAVGDLDVALDLESTRARVHLRLQALGAKDDAEVVMSGFRSRLADMIVPLIEETPALASADIRPQIVDQAADRLRARWFRDIEAQCKDYHDRDTRQRSLDTLAEWSAWALLRDRAERLIALAPEEEDALFHTAYVRVCNFAVFQHNVCLRRYFAHEIYSWLHRHADSDRAAADLLMRNMKASEAP
jgi:hypothetical protein